MEGPWCRFRREARAREQHRHAAVDSLKVLDPERPIREAEVRFLRISGTTSFWLETFTKRSFGDQLAVDQEACCFNQFAFQAYRANGRALTVGAIDQKGQLLKGSYESPLQLGSIQVLIES